MECCANDFGPRLIKVVSVRNSPPRVCDGVVYLGRRGCVRCIDLIDLFVWVRLRCDFFRVPGKDSTVPGDSIDLQLSLSLFVTPGTNTHCLFVIRKPGAKNDIPVSSKRLWLESLDRIKSIQPRRHVSRRGQEVPEHISLAHRRRTSLGTHLPVLDQVIPTTSS